MNNKNRTAKNIYVFFILITIVFSHVSCNLTTNHDIIDQGCGLVINRFEKDFFTIDDAKFDLDVINCKERYPNFFMDPKKDIKTDLFLNDSLRTVFDSVMLINSSMPSVDKLYEGFCNYKDYFPKDTFSIITYIDHDFDYRYPVVYAKEKLFVALHMFLGHNHSFYHFLPDYIRFMQDTTFFPITTFATLAGKHITPTPTNNLLEAMIFSAKPLLFVEKMLPGLDDYKLLRCYSEKMDWCKNNEKLIWEYMVENEYLFSSNSELIDGFISLAPFSSFGLEIDTNSPGGVGTWLGLQILRSYEKAHKVSLLEILRDNDYIDILNKSGYRP